MDFPLSIARAAAQVGSDAGHQGFLSILCKYFVIARPVLVDSGVIYHSLSGLNYLL